MILRNTIELEPLGIEITQAVAEDRLPEPGLSAVYPLVFASTADYINSNYYCYPWKSMVGSESNPYNPTGHKSYTTPIGKPVLRDHKLTTDFFGISKSSILGRVVWAGVRREKEMQNKKNSPLLSGSGMHAGLLLLLSITDPEAIQKVLSGEFDAVSTGTYATKIVESVTGEDVLKARREGKDLKYRRGEVSHDGQVSHWIISEWRGMEISYVNNPADINANTESRDLGRQYVTNLLAEKVVGANRFKFYDMKTLEQVNFLDEIEEQSFDIGSKFVDSYQPKNKIWVTDFGGILTSNSQDDAVPTSSRRLDTLADNILGKTE